MLTAPQFSPAALQSVRTRIVRAAERAGRDPGSVRLLAVSKQQPAALVRAAATAGQTEFGENYVQEGIDKIAALADVPGLAWHFIGQLQGNKTREVAECFDWVHTVDRERIAARLSAQRPRDAAPLQVLLQVRLADEPGKGGVDSGGSTGTREGGRRPAAAAVARTDVHSAASGGPGGRSGNRSGSCASCWSHSTRPATRSTPCRWA